MRAAKRGSGLRLTPEEVFTLSMDDAIRQRAMNDSDIQAEELAKPTTTHPQPEGTKP
jgi:hypothetical protein